MKGGSEAVAVMRLMAVVQAAQAAVTTGGQLEM